MLLLLMLLLLLLLLQAAVCKLQVAVVIVAENVDKMEHVASTTWQQLWPINMSLQLRAAAALVAAVAAAYRPTNNCKLCGSNCIVCLRLSLAKNETTATAMASKSVEQQQQQQQEQQQQRQLATNCQATRMRRQKSCSCHKGDT
uniref:HDC18812 n=1 Tax=Drosophila melanogaster TaxID=7227 RepID=Q6IID3_DROME|nr:TPA_inf: HDC18812 [Drosophila melanogaster]